MPQRMSLNTCFALFATLLSGCSTTSKELTENQRYPTILHQTSASEDNTSLRNVPVGAKANGKTDDTAAIQKALFAGNGPVFLPAGKYLISDSLQIPSNSGIYGFGTLYQTAEKVTLINYPDDKEASNIVVEGIKIKKKFNPQSEADGIFFKNTENLRIHDVEISGIGAVSGIYLLWCENFSITNCYIHDFKNTWTQTKLSNSKNIWSEETPKTKRNADALGIHLRYCKFGVISGNRIENLVSSEASADAIGWQTDGINPQFSEQINISNNIIRNVGEGIDVVGGRSISVTGNVIEGCWHFGIKVIHGASFVTVSNNAIRNAALAGISLYFGGPQWGDSKGNVIVGNTIANIGSISRNKGLWKGWPTAGIEIVNDNNLNNSVFDCLISNNVIYDNQKKATCQYGIIERHIIFESDGSHKAIHGPIDDSGIYTNMISGNLIRGTAIREYHVGSKVQY